MPGPLGGRAADIADERPEPLALNARAVPPCRWAAGLRILSGGPPRAPGVREHVDEAVVRRSRRRRDTLPLSALKAPEFPMAGTWGQTTSPSGSTAPAHAWHLDRVLGRVAQDQPLAGRVQRQGFSEPVAVVGDGRGQGGRD